MNELPRMAPKYATKAAHFSLREDFDKDLIR